MKKLTLLILFTSVTFVCFSQQKHNHSKKHTIEFDSTLIKEINGWILTYGRPTGSNQNLASEITFEADSFNVEEFRNWILKNGRPTNPKHPTISVPNCAKCFKRHIKHHSKSNNAHLDI